jgi:predicted transcriptional regulator
MQSLFTVEEEPYTLFEISEALGIPYKRLHYCYKVLSQREATKEKVKPLDGRRPLQFTAATANLITRNCSALKRAKKAEESSKESAPAENAAS